MPLAGKESRVTKADLEAHYLAYIAALNDRRTGDLAEFVHDELTYNDEPITRRQYQDLISADIAAIPDLFYDVRLLVVDEEQVACRLRFDCTPVRDFLGLSPTGKRVSFAEHVFYRFRDGRIAAVWSLIDRPAIETQLRG
jgi:predicted ester cyclase